MPLLHIENVEVRFGGVVALSGASFEVKTGEICALIGPNGAGKTTLFNVVSRLYEPTRGTVRFQNNNLLKVAPHQIATLGIGRTFQNLALVPGLSVLDNVLVGAHSRSRGGFWATATVYPARPSEQQTRTAGLAMLERLDLAHLAQRPCAGLPYGTLKRIEIARALMCQPELLLLDEPASGLTHGEVDELAELIRTLRDELATTMLLVEHHMGMVMAISDRIVVMESGTVIATGTPAEIRADQRVISAYLGAPT
jgi:branched-chain amino acid transport system ATP-binding protein